MKLENPSKAHFVNKTSNTMENGILSQVGNPEGADKPNKKFYDPRVWIRKSEESMIVRAKNAFVSLNGVNVLGDSWAKK